MASGGVLDLNVIRKAELHRQPYEYILNSHLVRNETISDVRHSFPNLRTPGFHPLDDIQMKGALGDFITEMQGADLSSALADK